jgi:hypothetical protein
MDEWLPVGIREVLDRPLDVKKAELVASLDLVAMIDFFKNSTRLAVQTQPPSARC